MIICPFPRLIIDSCQYFQVVGLVTLISCAFLIHIIGLNSTFVLVGFLILYMFYSLRELDIGMFVSLALTESCMCNLLLEFADRKSVV